MKLVENASDVRALYLLTPPRAPVRIEVPAAHAAQVRAPHAALRGGAACKHGTQTPAPRADIGVAVGGVVNLRGMLTVDGILVRPPLHQSHRPIPQVPQ